jgi:F-type H+-transporting ATPase subunit epsilon
MAAPATSPLVGPLRVVVISPERTLFDGEAEMVVAPAWDGEIGILRGHAPLMALLGSGEMRVKQGGAVERFQVEGGFLQVVDNAVTVLSEKANQIGNREQGTGNR